MKSRERSKIYKTLLIISIILVSVLLSLLVGWTILYRSIELNRDKLTTVNNGVRVYSSTGSDTTLYNSNRSIIEIEQLPKYVLDAFVSTEDKRFYEHNGYDLKRIIKATLVNISTNSKSQGASTISQQLIKNTLLNNEKTFSRKLKEVVLSMKMEKEFTKDEILEMYLNTIYFGSNAYGLENASKTYFNKSAKDLSLNESCCLAGIIKSPKIYSPINNFEKCMNRKNLVAKLMLDNHYITSDEYKSILANNPILTPNKNINSSYEQEAIYEACRLLNITERELINKGYQIITFKDDSLQNMVAKSNSSIISSANDVYSTSLDGLSIVTNSQGHIQAYYANSNYNLHNIARQPASILKPLAVYLPCLIHNILTPASIIIDEEINYNGYSPKNADNKFHGPVSARDALSHSYNIPAVKALDCVGLSKARNTLTSLGINITNSDLNLGLALGGTYTNIRLIDLLSSYNTLANMGKYNPLCFVDKILDEQGNTIYSHEQYSQQIIDSSSVYLLNDMLKDASKYGTGKRLDSLDMPIACKTGTASVNGQNTDLYSVAYTTEHTLLTWISNLSTNKIPNEMLSSSQPTDINKEIFAYLYSNHKPDDFARPKDIIYAPYDIIESEKNHRLISPTNTSERYIAYDYFKSNNLPKDVSIENSVQLSISIDRKGVKLDFLPKRSQIYYIYREDTSKVLLNKIQNCETAITIRDKNIFDKDNITYYIEDSNGKIISEIKSIRPKDYLIGLVDNQILNKKKWSI